MSVLTVETLEEAIKVLRKFGRSPVFEYSHYVTSIYEGVLVDEVLQQTHPGFNKLYNKGYLVPIRYRRVIEDLSDSKNEST